MSGPKRGELTGYPTLAQSRRHGPHWLHYLRQRNGLSCDPKTCSICSHNRIRTAGLDDPRAVWVDVNVLNSYSED